MSVLIKDMEMPTNCRECPVALNGKYCRVTKSHTTIIVLKARPGNCPLVEVPTPHGRLVEAGAVIEKANHEAEAMSGSLKEFFGQLVEWIVDKTPTVIDAGGRRMSDRNCDTCIHRKDDGCESWDCEYEPREDMRGEE